MSAVAIDARGMRCPWPAIRLARAIRNATDLVTIHADDPAAEREMTAVAEAAGWQLSRVGDTEFSVTRAN